MIPGDGIGPEVVAEGLKVLREVVSEVDATTYDLGAGRWHRTGEPVSVSGTLTGPTQQEKLTEVDGYDVDLRLEGHLLFFRYTDRPGVVGVVGARLGDAGVNIAGAQVSRTRRGGEALMVVTVDSQVPADLLQGIGTAIGATSVRGADIDTE